MHKARKYMNSVIDGERELDAAWLDITAARVDRFNEDTARYEADDGSALLVSGSVIGIGVHRDRMDELRRDAGTGAITIWHSAGVRRYDTAKRAYIVGPNGDGLVFASFVYGMALDGGPACPENWTRAEWNEYRGAREAGAEIRDTIERLKAYEWNLTHYGEKWPQSHGTRWLTRKSREVRGMMREFLLQSLPTYHGRAERVREAFRAELAARASG